MLVLAVAATAASADPPRPLTTGLFSFPGTLTGPSSGTSAGLALADRWLGEDPSGNPAVASGLRIIASPALLRVGRQDLASHNRTFSETAAFIDGAGLTIGLPAYGPLAVALYVAQPVLRFEDTAYTQGLPAPGPQPPPAIVQTHTAARETRFGGAFATRFGAARAGIAIEWTRREDDYRHIYQAGSPDDGTTELSFSGGALGGQVGVRWDHGDSLPGAMAIGAALRYVPAIDFHDRQVVETLAESSDTTTTVTRSSGIEAGLSGRFVLGPTFAAFASVGGRTSQRWDAYGLEAGSGWEWKVGGEFHDASEPWTFRFGGGMERQDGVPEPRAGVLGVGFGWRFEDVVVDVGLVHRTLSHDALPNSFDDRLVLSLRAPR